MLSTSMGMGGADRQVLNLALRLRARGYIVGIVSLVSPGTMGEEARQLGVYVGTLGMRRGVPDPRALLRLARIIRQERCEVLHSHMVHANLLARLVRVLAPVPILVCTAHNTIEAGSRSSSRWRELAYRLTDPLCDLTTQVSRAGLERYVRVGAVPRGKIHYVPNGVDVETFYPEPVVRQQVRASLGFPEDVFVWLAVGRLEEQKDYPNMLRAFARVASKRETVLLIAGEGHLRQQAEALALELGIASKVHFLGVRRDVADLMRAADGYLMSSAWEGMPMVLLEAEASGLPVVATDVGGNREVVLEGQTGFLVPPKNPEALAQAMLRLMSLPLEVRQAMGKAGRAHVEGNYALERVVDHWEALYKELLQRKGIRV